MDLSHEAYIIKTVICEEAAIIRGALTAPHILMKPRIFQNGDLWWVILGDDRGVLGTGKSPALACESFDKAWRTELADKGEENDKK